MEYMRTGFDDAGRSGNKILWKETKVYEKKRSHFGFDLISNALSVVENVKYEFN